MAIILATALLWSGTTSAWAASGWQQVGVPDAANVTCLTTDARLSVVYACTSGNGVLRITQQRAASIAGSTGIPGGVSVTTIEPSPANPREVLAGTSAGIYRSTDSGATFQAASSGIPSGAAITALTFGTHGTDVLAGTATNGIFRSMNGGRSWSADDNGLSATPGISALTFDSHTKTFVAALASGGLYTSTTSTPHWSSAGAGLPSDHITGLTTLASGGLNSNGATLYATTPQGVYDSTNDGQFWTSLLDTTRAGTSSTLVADPSHAGTLYLGTTQTVLVSQDGGHDWHLVAHGIAGLVKALAPLANGASTTLYAVGSNGLFSYATTNTPNVGNTVAEGVIIVLFLAFGYWIWRRTRRALTFSSRPTGYEPRGVNSYMYARDDRHLPSSKPTRASSRKHLEVPPTPPAQPRTPQTRARTGGSISPRQTPPPSDVGKPPLPPQQDAPHDNTTEQRQPPY